ncbi:MAG: hypothetical protein GEV28_37730 [Actinophytocola sp.]|uniref:hypothetical protein n=1 Tax=Actinophytocola sp. TaxID=1872138 RepID=UPI001320CCDD|nr:hypothetical protein [Actinophytocola sp.]MPZ85817.1 hypothetical protein [Actinophytocola sp.]
MPLDEKLRQAYFWIVNHAIISPHYDMEFADGPGAEVTLGDSKARLGGLHRTGRPAQDRRRPGSGAAPRT